jgi:hypothetical protein
MFMSLTYDDLQSIRTIVEETVNPIKGEIEALGNDIKEIYEMLADLHKNTHKGDSFQKLSLDVTLVWLG